MAKKSATKKTAPSTRKQSGRKKSVPATRKVTTPKKKKQTTKTSNTKKKVPTKKASSTTKRGGSAKSAPVAVSPMAKVREAAKAATQKIKEAERRLKAQQRETLRATKVLERQQARMAAQQKREEERQRKAKEREDAKKAAEQAKEQEKQRALAAAEEAKRRATERELVIGNTKPDQAGMNASALGRDVARSNDPAVIKGTTPPRMDVQFLMPGYILDNDVNLVGGASGAQKSMWSMELAACTSRGFNMFRNGRIRRVRDVPKRHQFKVKLYSAEDAVDITKRRLIARGADMRNIEFPRYWVNPEDGSRVDISLTADYTEEYLEREWGQDRPRMAIFDMFDSFFSDGVTLSSDQKMVECLDILRTLSNKYHVCVLILLHSNKFLTSITDIFGGSKKVKGMVRNAVFIMPDPTDMSRNPRRLLFHAKSSYAEMSPNLAFKFSRENYCSFEWLPQFEGLLNLEDIIHIGTLVRGTREAKGEGIEMDAARKEDTNKRKRQTRGATETQNTAQPVPQPQQHDEKVINLSQRAQKKRSGGTKKQTPRK